MVMPVFYEPPAFVKILILNDEPKPRQCLVLSDVIRIGEKSKRSLQKKVLATGQWP